MKKITRRSFLKASAAAMVASGLAACGGSASSSAAGSAAAAGKGTIGILMPTLNAEFFAVTANSMAARLAEEGYTGNIQGFDNDAAQAVSVIENFITDGVQGIAYMTVDTAGDDALKDAMDAGIKVLTCGVENANYDVCQIMDNKATGYQIGEMAANYINENFGGSAKVAYITSTKSQNMMDRVEGYRQAMEELCPGADVVYEAECVDVGQGTTFAENLNTLHPDCKIIQLLRYLHQGDRGGVECVELSEGCCLLWPRRRGSCAEEHCRGRLHQGDRFGGRSRCCYGRGYDRLPERGVQRS